MKNLLPIHIAQKLREQPWLERLLYKINAQILAAARAEAKARMTKNLELKFSMPPATERGFFTATDGTSIYYEVIGKGKPLLFCYGLVCRREHWHHQIQHFSRHYRVILFDYRGHHCSESPQNDRNLTLEWCARDVIDLCNYLGVEQIVGMGHSLGVPVLTEVARLNPELLKGLVFVCGSVTNPFQKMFFSNRMDAVFQLGAALYEWAPDATTKIWRKFTDRNRLSFFLTSSFGFNPNLAEEQDILLYMDGVNKAPLSTFHGLLKDYSAFDGRPILKELKSPALVIAGGDDCITPMEVQEEMARLIPKGKLVKIAQGSHNAHMDLPFIVNGEIDAFLDRIGYR